MSYIHKTILDSVTLKHRLGLCAHSNFRYEVVFGGSRDETLNQRFVLIVIRQKGDFLFDESRMA